MNVDCLIIGAGHSGILLAHKLQKNHIKTCVLEREELIGDVWRCRPDNMLLLTTRNINHLPGLQFIGSQNSYIHRSEFAEYLAFYATHYGVNVMTQNEVTHLSRENDYFIVRTKQGKKFTARCVVNATGVFQKTKHSPLAACLNDDVMQLTLTDYRKPMQLAGKMRVAVVGDGVSGRQVAEDLVVNNIPVTLFCGDKKSILPNQIAGKSLFSWLSFFGILQADSQKFIGRWWAKKSIIPARTLNNKRLKSRGVILSPALVDIKEDQLIDASGKSHRVDAVIWCLGFEDDTSWCQLPDVVNEAGFVCQKGHAEGGKTAVPGFYMIGRRGLSCGASELICGAERDASRVATFVERYLSEL